MAYGRTHGCQPAHPPLAYIGKTLRMTCNNGSG